ncbi:MAG: YjbH domain-containing protein [bacterium]
MGWTGMTGRWAQGLCIIGTGLAFAAGIAGAQELAAAPPRKLIDLPTAGLVPEASFEASVRAFPGGGLVGRADVGLLSWLSLGGAYGGMQLIGDGRPDWYPEPAFALKIRLLEEDYSVPALAVGIDTEGRGYFDEERGRYQYKSRGLYLVLSKNYAWYGDFSFHGGINRSLEEGDDESINPFLGFEKSLGWSAGFALEYDVALNDREIDGAYGKGRGYLNGSLRWASSSGMGFQFSVRDMLKNAEQQDPAFSDVVVDEGFGREFTLAYLESF